ncbi:MAG: tetratricopeptide repeat protein [Nocardioides sp.]
MVDNREIGQAEPDPVESTVIHPDPADPSVVHVAGDHSQVVIGDGNQISMTQPRRAVAWPVRIGQAPERATGYQQRHEVLAGIADVSGTVVLTQVLAGDGGVGKSQIAAGLYAEADTDLAVWATAESQAAVVSLYAQAAWQLDLVDDDRDVEDAAAQFLSFLSATDRSWLVVLDDIQDPADLKGLWPQGDGRVVATTRRRDAALSDGGRTLLEVSVFTPDEASQYLADRLHNHLTAGRVKADALTEADELAEELGFLPLALAHATAVIIDDGSSCAEFQRRFRDRTRSLAELFPDDKLVDGYRRTIASTWSIAIEQANQIPPAGLALPMARLIALMDPAGLPEEVCLGPAAQTFLGAPSPTEDPMSADLCRGALRALHRLSLIEHRPDGGPRAVRMHQLTQRAVQEALDRGGLLRVAADALLEAWPTDDNQDTAERADAFRANTLAVINHPDNASLWEPDAHPVMSRCGASLLTYGLYNDAIDYWHELATTSHHRLGDDHLSTLVARGALAGAYRSGGRFQEELALLEQGLADLERLSGSDDPNTLVTRDSLALAYRNAGRIDEAIALQEQVVADFDRVFGYDHPERLIAWDNLASSYREAGRTDDAIALQEQLVADFERVLGSEHPDTWTARRGLATSYQNAGQTDKAIGLHEQALAAVERVFGSDHPETLTARGGLASSYRDAGNHQQALALFEKLLPDFERVLGHAHPATLTARENLATSYLSSSRVPEAIALFGQVLADRERVLGHDHPATSTTRDILTALVTRGAIPDHPNTLLARHHCAAAHQDAGEWDHAVALYEDILTDSERVLGPDDPNTLAARYNLALAYTQIGDWAKAVDSLHEAFTAHKRVLGPDHEMTTITQGYLGCAYAETGNWAKAIATFNATLDAQERVLGPDHAHTRVTRENLARIATQPPPPPARPRTRWWRRT